MPEATFVPVASMDDLELDHQPRRQHRYYQAVLAASLVWGTLSLVAHNQTPSRPPPSPPAPPYTRADEPNTFDAPRVASASTGTSTTTSNPLRAAAVASYHSTSRVVPVLAPPPPRQLQRGEPWDEHSAAVPAAAAWEGPCDDAKGSAACASKLRDDASSCRLEYMRSHCARSCNVCRTPPTTPPPPLPSPDRTDAVIAALNRRFERGEPSADLASAGVLMRVIDELGDPKAQWLPCPASAWCEHLADRMPASLVNRHAPRLYAGGEWRGGFVMRPDAATVLCAYHADGSTQDKLCSPRGVSADCVPGCPTGHASAHWCASQDDWQCAWRADQIDEALRQGANAAHERWEKADKADRQPRDAIEPEYNELIIDPSSFVEALPGAVEAFFVFGQSLAPLSANMRAMRRVRAAFLQRYDLSEDEVPMLRYAPGSASSSGGTRGAAFGRLPWA